MQSRTPGRADTALPFLLWLSKRDDCEERQVRLDWMIDEFEEARRRRLAQASGGPVESQLQIDATTTTAAASPVAEVTDPMCWEFRLTADCRRILVLVNRTPDPEFV